MQVGHLRKIRRDIPGNKWDRTKESGQFVSLEVQKKGSLETRRPMGLMCARYNNQASVLCLCIFFKRVLNFITLASGFSSNWHKICIATKPTVFHPPRFGNNRVWLEISYRSMDDQSSQSLNNLIEATPLRILSLLPPVPLTAYGLSGNCGAKPTSLPTEAWRWHCGWMWNVSLSIEGWVSCAVY